MDKYSQIQDGAITRAHNDLFQQEEYQATFYTYTAGTYDPSTGEVTGATRSELTTAHVEIVPPEVDTTVDLDGSDVDFTTSLQFPKSLFDVTQLDYLGSEKTPSEVEVGDDVEGDTTTYQVQGYHEKRGSGLVLLRVVED